MGKKQKAKLNKLKNENRPPVPYTESERNVKVTKILTQLMMLQLDEYLSDEVRSGLTNFIKTGESYIYDFNIPQISRVLNIYFINDKNLDKNNSINVVFNKIRINDDTDIKLKRKVNELNEAQENMFQI